MFSNVRTGGSFELPVRFTSMISSPTFNTSIRTKRLPDDERDPVDQEHAEGSDCENDSPESVLLVFDKTLLLFTGFTVATYRHFGHEHFSSHGG